MAEKIMIEVFKKKTMEELSQALADPDGKLETGSGAAVAASVAAALLCRAAAVTGKTGSGNERLDYIARNGEILRSYMVHLIDEDVKCRGPLQRAIKEGDARNIEAARQPAVSICAEIMNMMGKLLELARELCPLCPKEARHYLAESAGLAMAAARTARSYIVDMAAYSSDETYRFVTRRENELLLAQFAPLAEEIIKSVEA